MCSFGASTREGLEHVNFFAAKRGPDKTNLETVNNIHFIHNLLHITGELTPQPIKRGDVCCVYNGEIYNYKELGSYTSDGESIVDLYLAHGYDFAKHLDGEYAICIVDFKNSVVVLATDPFACKPLWYEFIGNEFCVASYESQCVGLGFMNSEKLFANKTTAYSMDSGKLLHESENFTFDIDNQHKTSYDDWIVAFENSIRKRTSGTQFGIFTGLSSGYDSGAISWEMHKQGVDFIAYSVQAAEEVSILNMRSKLLNNNVRVKLNQEIWDSVYMEINQNCEPFFLEYKGKPYQILKDKASVGLGSICRLAKENDCKIYLSGQGADETISDYGWRGRKIYWHSCFGGDFPTDLRAIYPWPSLFGGTQLWYINKEEYVAGSYGIETRYPFLDPRLFQEFLWLTSNLKNLQYKSTLNHYVAINNFPTASRKIGFDTLKGVKY